MSFPTVLPSATGQTVLSLVENDARFAGRPVTTHLAHLTGRRSPLCSSTMPCGGHDIGAVFDGVYGSGRHLVTEHSAAPLYAMGMSSEQADKLVGQLASGFRYRTACPQFAPALQCGNRAGMQCPECAREVEATYGFPVGFVWHVFDFVTRCPKHESPLTSDGHRSLLEALLNNVHTSGARENSLRYSRCVHELLQAGPHQPLWPVIVRKLSAEGFMTAEGHWRLELLDKAVKTFYSAGFEDARLNWMVKNMAVGTRCVRALARGRPIHPVLLILLYQMATQPGSMPNPKPLRVEPKYLPSLDEQLVQRNRAKWESHMAANVRLSRTQLRFALPATWTWLYRHDRAWLLSNQVPATKPAGGRKPGEIPGPLLDAIRGNTTEFRYSAEGREPLPSAYQERLGLGMTEYAFDRVTRALSEGEPRAQLPARKQLFVSRRVARATEDLGNRGTQALSVIARAARLRPETLIDFYRPI